MSSFIGTVHLHLEDPTDPNGSLDVVDVEGLDDQHVVGLHVDGRNLTALTEAEAIAVAEALTHAVNRRVDLRIRQNVIAARGGDPATEG